MDIYSPISGLRYVSFSTWLAGVQWRRSRRKCSCFAGPACLAIPSVEMRFNKLRYSTIITANSPSSLGNNHECRIHLPRDGVNVANVEIVYQACSRGGPLSEVRAINGNEYSNSY